MWLNNVRASWRGAGLRHQFDGMFWDYARAYWKHFANAYTGGSLVAVYTLYRFLNDRPLARIAGFVLIGAVLVIASYRTWREERDRVIVLSGGAVGAPYVRESPREILARFAALRPLERELVMKRTYIGRPVRWSGTVGSVAPRSLGSGFTVSVSHDDWPSTTYLFFNRAQRAIVETLVEGTAITYTGKITEVSTLGIQVGKIQILSPEFLPRTESV